MEPLLERHLQRPLGLVGEPLDRLVGGNDPGAVVLELRRAEQAGELQLQGGLVSLPEFRPLKSAEAVAHWEAVRQYLNRCQLQLPLYSELLEATRISDAELRQAIKAAVKSGKLHRLNDSRYALPEHLLTLSQRVVAADRDGEELSVVGLKSHFGSGRKLTIELLEYFDSIHFTRRQGDKRILVDREAATERFSV